MTLWQYEQALRQDPAGCAPRMHRMNSWVPARSILQTWGCRLTNLNDQVNLAAIRATRPDFSTYNRLVGASTGTSAMPPRLS